MKSMQYKAELALVKAQNIDVTTFEKDLEGFKNAFARNYDLKIALLARTKPAENPINVEDEKKICKEKLQLQGKATTPLAIREAMRPLHKAEEARQNIRALQDLGAEVLFYQCSIENITATQNTIDSILDSWSHIDLCIHSAGMERSKPFKEKTLNEFRW